MSLHGWFYVSSRVPAYSSVGLKQDFFKALVNLKIAGKFRPASRLVQ
jgi:hypothetical protein